MLLVFQVIRRVPHCKIVKTNLLLSERDQSQESPWSGVSKSFEFSKTTTRKRSPYLLLLLHISKGDIKFRSLSLKFIMTTLFRLEIYVFSCRFTIRCCQFIFDCLQKFWCAQYTVNMKIIYFYCNFARVDSISSSKVAVLVQILK
jgi:hypothetical protein